MGFFSRLFGRGNRATSHTGTKAADTFTGLRDLVLQLRYPPQVDGTLALLMETGYPVAVVTLAVVHDGTTSLYFSNGGGIIGAGEHETVRLASADLLRLVDRYTDQMSDTRRFPLPDVGRVRFYVIESGRVLTAEAAEQDLGNHRETLSPLFHEAHRVIAAIREQTPQ